MFSTRLSSTDNFPFGSQIGTCSRHSLYNASIKIIIVTEKRNCQPKILTDDLAFKFILDKCYKNVYFLLKKD